MSIQFPIRVHKGVDARFAYLVDARDGIIGGAFIPEDAEQLVAAANAGANIKEPIAKPERRKNKKELFAEELKDSDYTAKEVGRDDVIYGHHDSLPACGEPVARLGSKAR